MYNTLIKDEFLMSLIKFRLGCLVIDLLQHFGIYLVVFALKCIIHGKEVTENNFKSSGRVTG